MQPAPDLPRPPRQVVSLVPSLTESLFDLGFGKTVVGITDYCIHPGNALAGLPRVGGPKNPRLDEILALKPDLVLANREENTRPAIEGLRSAGLTVWVTHPQTVQQAMEVLWSLAALFKSQTAVASLKALGAAIDWAKSAAGENRRRYFCPIWYGQTQAGQSWWMTFNQQTYCHDLLGLVGGENCFAERERRYPLAADLGLEEPQEAGERDKRYPRLTLEEICQARPEIILLPDEPFEFGEPHRQEMLELLADTPAVRQGRVYLVEGSLITWHGTRLARALRELPPLFNR